MKKILAPWYFSALERRTVHFGKAIKDKQEAGPADMERAALKEDWTVARLCAKERALRRLEIENIDWTTTAAVALHTAPPKYRIPFRPPSDPAATAARPLPS